jgi:hypothetical protein
MICPPAGPSAVSVLRRYGQYRTLPLLLALLGAFACGGENPAAPSADLKSPEIHYLVAVGTLDYTTPDAQAVTTVQGLESNVRSMSTDVGITPPTFAYSRVAPVTVSATILSASQTKVGGGTIPPPPIAFYLPQGCTKAYIDCVQQCLLTRIEFNSALGDFGRANSDFWDNIINPFHSYLNHLSGGPQDQMSNSYYNMVQSARLFRAQDCSHYL